MSCGIVLLDKPQGLSSAQAIARVKRALSLKKIGHAGTLDPMATGLLVCLVGDATRCAAYAEAGTKVYTGTALLGRRTSTDDVTGETLTESSEIPALSAVEALLPHFTGEISQVPPAVSAIKVDGERSYVRFRRGEQVVLPPRRVSVYSFSIALDGPASFSFRIECSAGTYIRSLVRDIGDALGCGGTLASLRREHSAPFSVTEAKGVEQLSAADIVPWARLFTGIPRLTLSSAALRRLSGGDQRELNQWCAESPQLAAAHCALFSDDGGEPFGVLVKQGERWSLGVNLAAKRDLPVGL